MFVLGPNLMIVGSILGMRSHYDSRMSNQDQVAVKVLVRLSILRAYHWPLLAKDIRICRAHSAIRRRLFIHFLRFHERLLLP